MRSFFLLSRAVPFFLSSLACVMSIGDLAAESGGNYTARVMPGLWMSTLSGSVDYAAGGASSEVSASDLDLANQSMSLSVEAGVQLPILFDVYAGYSSYSTDGSGTAQTAFNFGNSVLLTNAAISTDLSLTDVYGELDYGINFDIGGAAIGVAAHSLSMKATVNAEDFDESFILPALAGRVHISPIDSWSAEARLHVLSLDVGKVKANFTDILLTVTYYPTTVFGVTGGYRQVIYDFEVEDAGVADKAIVDLKLGGPFIGVAAQF